MWPAGRSSWGNNPKLLINFHSALTLAFLVLHFLTLTAAVPIGRPRSQQEAFYAKRNTVECKLATPLVTIVSIFHVCFNLICHFWNVIIIISSTWNIVLTGDITSGCGIQLWKNRSIVEECGNRSCRRKRKEVILEPIESSGALSFITVSAIASSGGTWNCEMYRNFSSQQMSSYCKLIDLSRI